MSQPPAPAQAAVTLAPVDAGRRSAHRLRLVALFAGFVLEGFLLGIASLLLLAPVALGGRALTEMSGSMSPALRTGDVVITRSISALDLGAGDIVAFRDPGGSSRLITHRVRSIRVMPDAVRVVTRGDANTSSEVWYVSRDGSVGRVIYRVPKLGFALHYPTLPLGRIGLVAVPAVLLALIAVLQLWRPRPVSTRSQR